MEISQFLPSIAQYGAISHFVLQLRAIITQMGYDSYVYCENKGGGLPRFVRHYSSYKDHNKNIIILHASIKHSINTSCAASKAKKILVYYSPTPAVYFQGHDTLYSILTDAPTAIQKILPAMHITCGISEFCQNELKKMGSKNAQVLPVITDCTRFSTFNKKIYRSFHDDHVNILFVGRIVPHKKIEDIIRIFYYYKTFINPHSRLFLIGPHTEYPAYYQSLLRYLTLLNLRDVNFSGEISDYDLGAYYRLADLFLCMSEHEGFCAPLIESMYFKIPIIAYARTAVPFTLKKSGVLVYTKNPKLLAELINIILNDQQLRKKIIQKQTTVSHYYSIPNIRHMFRSLITPLLPATS